MGDSHVGLQARLMSQALRKITGALSNSGTTAIFINQLREKIGVMFGSPETTTGGKALKFYASVRLDVRRIETLKDGTEPVGNRTRVKVVKNKMAPPFKQAEFDILYGIGISREGGLIDMGVEQGFVRKSGAWYTYEGDQLGQGKENARTFLRDNPDLANEIEKRIKEKLGIGPRLDAPPADVRRRLLTPGRLPRSIRPVAAPLDGAAAGRPVRGPGFRRADPGHARRPHPDADPESVARTIALRQLTAAPAQPGPARRRPRPRGRPRRRRRRDSSTGSRMSGSSTTPSSRGSGRARGRRAAVWPGVPWRTSCASGGSTATSSRRRSTTPSSATSSRPHARWPAAGWLPYAIAWATRSSANASCGACSACSRARATEPESPAEPSARRWPRRPLTTSTPPSRPRTSST